MAIDQDEEEQQEEQPAEPTIPDPITIEPAFTAGPWTIDQAIGIVADAKTITVPNTTGLSAEESSANAQLMTGAPCLFEFIERLEARFRINGNFDIYERISLITEMDALLLKAAGPE